jgi:hypothetical protein
MQEEDVVIHGRKEDLKIIEVSRSSFSFVVTD